jgi:bifunctional non-homologous end joining protein LigD
VASRKQAPAAPPTAGDAVDEQLARYRSMRDFKVTAEPSGGSANKHGEGLPFVIQKHAATRLHYDFRLGWDGVLKSWAVAKGPSYNVHDKRLAVQVEDHPMEYGGFEGIIPKGQYGGGTVMVWDQGTWEPHTDFAEGLRKGTLKFGINGTKMHGNWTLVRMGGKAAHEGKPNWLLIKEHDEFERGPDDPCITEEAPNSAVTGRTLEEIAVASTHVWNSKETAGEGQAWYRQKARDADAASGAVASKPKKAPAAKAAAPSAVLDAMLAKLPKEAMPDFLKPQLADEAQAPPAGPEWVHELKLDGYRVQAHKRGKQVSLFTRSGLDWTHRMKPVAVALAAIQAESAILDGEVTVLDAEGLSSFARLQASFEKNEKHPLTFFGFDLLHINGRNPRDLPLRERKHLLRDALGEDTDEIRLSEDLAGDGAEIFAAACKLHAEGIISKRADAPYAAGRSTRWLKSKCLFEQEFVVGGWVDLSNGSRGVGSLLLGYYDDAGKLIYAGRTGTGFTQKIHKMLRDKLDAIDQKTMPFTAISAEGRRGAHWVKPELVVQVRFATWTAEQQVRQASYQGLREDKQPAEVRREQGPPTAKFKPKAEVEQPAPTPKSTASKRPSKAAPMPAIRLTHPDKIVDPDSGVTKQQLAEFLWSVSSEMLPHIADRPLSVVRCPEGSGKQCFYQKHVNHLLPKGVGSVMVADKKGGEPEPYITLNDAEALVGLAQMSVLEIHPWGSRNQHLEQPDRIIIDLDPDESLPWSTVAEAALEIRELLTAMGLQSFLKTTGGKGLHVAFPVKPEHDFAVMKAWAHGFVQAIEQARPELYLSKMSKAARVGKIYLDYLRNERGATAVAPYSMRARSGLPVSVPLEWKELSGAKERPRYSITNFEEWRERLRSNPWQKMLTVQQSLSKDALERFAGKQTKRK